MKLERITLTNFRSYTKKTIVLGDTTLLVAPNGSGKTNLLEAIFLLASGVSERASEITEMIKWEQEIGSVSAVVEDNEERSELSVVLTHGVYMGKKTPKRRYLVDGVARLKSKFVGRLVATLFRPEDMRLIEGSPSRRRGFLDEILSVANPEYGRAIGVYEASLRRRNRLLDAIRDGMARREQLAYWDQSIVKNGEIVNSHRREFLEYLSQTKTRFGAYELKYEDSPISPARLLQYAEAEVAVGYTLVGPHKDDFVIMSKQLIASGVQQDRDLMKYGSRGEQRLGVLFLKLGGMRYLEEKLGVKSILLLDDIFSELDQVHREEVVAMIGGRQTIVTSAEGDVSGIIAGADVISIE